MISLRLALVLLAAALFAQALEGDPAAILNLARANALNYSRSLPDFTCTELISRYDNGGGPGPWTAVDKLTMEVSFSGQREDYRLVARNGRPADRALEDVSGALTRGEFGSALLLIFQPNSATSFQWKRWEHLHGRRLAEFAYRVTAEKSHYVLQRPGQSAVVGFHGIVDMLPEDGAVFRWTVEAEPPKDFPVLSSSVRMDYDYRKIEGASYLLPVHAEMLSSERGLSGKEADRLPPRARTAATRPIYHRNVIEFQNYRKFGVDSSITFK
jgi:hypothetical protein